jgi:catechol 2,3-dioxygenase-like lactoylglutathione lyase family enzyme
MGFPLVHTEVERLEHDAGVSMMKHIFFDAGDGGAIAFFALDNVGERPDWKTDLADSVGVPVWVNHCAFRANAEQQEEVRQRMSAAGIEPLMEVDHGWCHSLYYVDPNGIMVEFCRDTPGFEPDGDEARRVLAESREESREVA